MRIKLIIFFTFCILIILAESIEAKTYQTSEVSSSNIEAIYDELEIKKDDVVLFVETTNQLVASFKSKFVEFQDRSISIESRSKIYMELTELFVLNAEVSSKYYLAGNFGGEIKRSIDVYLSRLKSLPNQKSKIESFELIFVNELFKLPGNRYTSMATIIHGFKGFKDEQLLFDRISHQNIEVPMSENDFKFFLKHKWMIYIGNVWITEYR